MQDLANAIKELIVEYEKACINPAVDSPICYALYHIWKNTKSKGGRETEMKYDVETKYPNPVIAERVQQVFNEHNLSDPVIAKAVGVERKTILAYRNCYSNPSIKFLRYICKTYKVSADWLLNI